jgi:2-oxoglutarate ferredoxin oxidoreductase subunit beta
MSVAMDQTARELQEHPSAPLLRMERIPHVWCPSCGIGTVVKCYATAAT